MNFLGSRLGFWFVKNPVSISWTLTQSGIIPGSPGGWYISNRGTRFRFEVQDSQNCGGSNPNVQSGTATATITTEYPFYMYYDIVGRGEAQDAGFENLSITIQPQGSSPILLVSATSNDLDQFCAPGVPVDKTIHVPPPYYLNADTQYTFNVNFTTFDNKFHVDCYYEGILTFVKA